MPPNIDRLLTDTSKAVSDTVMSIAPGRPRCWSFMLREVWPCLILENVCSAARSSPSSVLARPSCFASPPKKSGRLPGPRASPKFSPRLRSSTRRPRNQFSRAWPDESKRLPTVPPALRHSPAQCINCRRVRARQRPAMQRRPPRRLIHSCEVEVDFLCPGRILRRPQLNRRTTTK